MWELLKVYWKLRLIHYGLFLGMTGGLATLVGPDRNHWIKLAIGVTIGCLILGKRFPYAIKALIKWTDNYFHEENNL